MVVWHGLRTAQSTRADIDGFVQKALADPRFQAAHPNLTYSMHAWYDTPEKWARFEAQLDKYGHRSDWWYCNQNQYGAYRYQFQRAKLTPAAPQGKTLRLHLERPMLLDLNDDTPLTLEVAGVRPDDIVSVTCPTAACKASQRKGGLFHVYHDKDQALPKKIGMVPVNFANRHAPAKDDYDSDFPDLHALVHFEGGQVRFLMENRSDKALSRVRLTYRLPLAWKEGVVRRELPDLPAGTSAADALRPTLAQSDLRYNTGRGFYAVQVDFVLGDQPGRLHLACITASSKQADPSYPCNGFVLLGPVPKEQLDGDKFAKNVQDGRVGLVDFVTGDQRRLSWRAADPMRQFRAVAVRAEMSQENDLQT